MTVFPTPHTVDHSSVTVVGENALGQVVTEKVTRSRAVFGWSFKSTSDGGTAPLAGRVHTEVALLTPEPDWRDGDIVTLPDRGDFVVIGDPEDFNTGPFGFTPGYRVTLRRVHVEPD